MTPWIILCGASCALGIFSVALLFLASFGNGALFFVACLQGSFVAVGVYCFLLVYSYYSQVKEERLVNDSRFKQLGE